MNTIAAKESQSRMGKNPVAQTPVSARRFRHPLHRLQNTLGNRAVQRLIQAKLTVAASDDEHEREANRVAREVLNMSDASVSRMLRRMSVQEEDKDEMLHKKPLAGSISPLIHRQLTTTEDEEELVQAKKDYPHAGSFDAGEAVETQLGLSKGRGSPLPDTVREFMEPRFGVDFGEVRVHADAEALSMTEAVGAQAFTHGRDVYFGAGHSPAELALTAHELTHVVQQAGAMPLQANRLDDLALAGAESSVQRVCGACTAGGSPCASCGAEEGPIQRKEVQVPSDRQVKRGAVAGHQQISRAPKSVQRYSWDEFTDDVASVGEAAVEGVEEVGSAVVSGAEAVGGAVVSGAEAVGEAVVSGAEAVASGAEAVGSAVVSGAEAVVSGVEAAGEAVVSGVEGVVQAGGEAVDWLLTEAGQLALSGANALAGLVGGSVTVGPSGLIIDIPEIELFESHKEEIIPPTPRVYVPLLAAGAAIGPVVLIGSVGIPVGAPTWTVFLGPGRLQNIVVRIDPAASTYTASGEVYVGAAQNAYMQTGAALRVDAITVIPTDPPIPVDAALEGGFLLTLQGSEVGSIARAVTLGYSSGAISLDLTDTLQLGVILEADLDAYLNAQLYEIELCEFIWPLEHWEASKAETYSLPISLSFSGGAASITIGPISGGAIPVEDIETTLERFRPESHCKEFEEVIEELCERGILPPEVCDILDEDEAEILVKYRCWAGRNCTGKAYSKKFTHCHNCKNAASGKSLGEPGNCENC
ncbi:MAG: eCIS core domain-containing protein [bacterium]